MSYTEGVKFLTAPPGLILLSSPGTGKSSIVCALCLGLGGSTTLLGRAKDVSKVVLVKC